MLLPANLVEGGVNLPAPTIGAKTVRGARRLPLRVNRTALGAPIATASGDFAGHRLDADA
ncbi:hypothetical protein GCM10022402_36550 [Salinactinospora qingdaonensis]|uniref:Uncharacterized protein n=1 Tax=Salinactinospora qingdaonensis TaxID=702744 RepID=A0ABP7G939_9ACTN